MTGSRVGNGPHIDDGELIRLFDGECSPEERERIGAHIDACPECRSNADSLKKASELFSNSLMELEARASAPPKREITFGKKIAREKPRFSLVSPRVLRIAAALALTVLVFTATPARAWLAKGWEALTSLVASEPVESNDVADVPDELVDDRSSILRFSPRAPHFRLEFTRRPAAGTLVLSFDSVRSASASIIGNETGDEMIVLPDGLRVRNSVGSSTSFEIELPLRLLLVEVSIEGSTVLTLDLSSRSEPFRQVQLLADDAGNIALSRP